MAAVAKNFQRSSDPAEAGSPRAGCLGSYPVGFWISPRMENAQTTCLASLCPDSVTLTVKIVSWCSEEISCVSVCAHCLWLCRWTPVHSLCTLPSGIYTHWWDPSEPSFLQREQSQLSQICSSTFTISAALCWTPSSSFISLLYWETQNRTQEKKVEYSFLTMISSAGIRQIFSPYNCFGSSFLHIHLSTFLSATNPIEREHIPPFPVLEILMVPSQAKCRNHSWCTKSPRADIWVMASSSGQSREVTWAWMQKAAADKGAHSWAHQWHCSGLSSARLADFSPYHYPVSTSNHDIKSSCRWEDHQWYIASRCPHSFPFT